MYDFKSRDLDRTLIGPGGYLGPRILIGPGPQPGPYDSVPIKDESKESVRPVSVSDLLAKLLSK
jgi:hypothetical protein